MGHDVTLFASGDSVTKARLCAPIEESIRCSEPPRDAVIPHLLQLTSLARQVDDFDIIHFHTDFMHFPLFRDCCVPHVTTMHGCLTTPDLPALLREFSDAPLISISNSQRNPIPRANWIATVYNGVPSESYAYRPRAGKYLAFLGRISPEKGPDRAIEIAKRVGLPLKIAAKVDRADRNTTSAASSRCSTIL
jgi:glycosyltransferase involved in cell wall biosynthesis